MFPVLRATVNRPGIQSRDRNSGAYFGAAERRLCPFLHTAVTAGNGHYAPVSKGRALRSVHGAWVAVRGKEFQSGRSQGLQGHHQPHHGKIARELAEWSADLGIRSIRCSSWTRSWSRSVTGRYVAPRSTSSWGSSPTGSGDSGDLGPRRHRQGAAGCSGPPNGA
jgi:hypothetical protein